MEEGKDGNDKEKQRDYDIVGSLGIIEEGTDEHENENEGNLDRVARERIEEVRDDDEVHEEDDEFLTPENQEVINDGSKEIESNGDKINEKTAKMQCLILRKPFTSKKGEKPSWEKYAFWRKTEKVGVAKLAKQLKARWEFEELIEEELHRFQVEYNPDSVPSRLKDISEFLMPESAPPLELASIFWLGDMRPSAILNLLSGLTSSSFSSSSSSGSSSSSNQDIFQRRLKQLINEIRIEESIVDAEMAEIQATCIFHLTFSPANILKSHSSGLTCIKSEFKKIENVARKAQQLRFKTVDLVVKKVLSEMNAAEFLVAFARIKDVIHQYAKKQKQPRGPMIALNSVKNLELAAPSQSQEPMMLREPAVCKKP